MGSDEAGARETLLAMHERLARDPYEALGLTGSPTPADIRQAFLSLTKQFHPARFGRMAPEIQRLANEVFLGLRAAHDQLARPSVKPRQTGMIPIQQPRVATPPAPPRTTTPTGAPATRPSSPTLNPPHNPGHHGTSPLRPLGTPTPPSSAAPAAPAKFLTTTPSTRPGVTPASTVPQPRVGAPRQPAPPGGVPIRSHTPPSGVPVRSTTPPSGVPVRSTTPPMGVRFNAPGTAAAAAAQPPRGPAAPPPADRELTPILALLDMGQFAACRVALETLVARSPNVPRYRALIAYSKGREAQLARRLDEARVELQEALQIDPGLDLAKSALGELFTRRK